MKIYQGTRNMEERNGAGFHITVDGERLTHLGIHSPTGFSWGYHGSGPADTALSILADHFGEQPNSLELRHGICRCWALHQVFKTEVVSRFPMDGDWILTTEEIDTFVKRHPIEMADAEERIQIWKVIGRRP